MSSAGEDTHPTMTYPTEDQYARWQTQAEEMGMSMSEFLQSMTEAGLKKFDVSVVEPDETQRELRQQRNDLKAELERARKRIGDLEDRLHHGERETIRRYVEDNPGASFDEIARHIIDTVPERVNSHLDGMEGDTLVRRDGEWHLAEAQEGCE